MRKLLIAVIVIVVVLVAADRVAAVVADRQIASRVETSYHLPSKPSVSVQGFPFLTQVAAGNYHEIDLSIGQLDSSGVQVNNLVAHLMGVHAPVRDLVGGNSSSITAAQVTGTGTVPLSSVQSRVPQGVQLSQAGGGLRMSGTVSYLGVSVPVSAVASLGVSPSGITVTPTRISLGSGISAPASAVSGQFRFTVPVTGLPLHLTLTSVSVTPAGVQVSASAANVAFTSGA
jgi:LmeA-like phospholipid-binding